jgi:hypothetical protein
MWDWGAIRLGYHDHYVVDGGKRRIILATLVTPVDVMESQAMRDLLWRVCFRRKIWPRHVTGDAKYGTIENIVALEDAGIRAYVPLTDFEHRSALYARDAFTYDAKRDQYCCPQGHLLPLARSKRTEDVVVYRADSAVCDACPVRPSAQPVTAAARSSGRTTRAIWRKCAGITPRRRTRRRSASAKSGWNRSLPRPRSGTAYAG